MSILNSLPDEEGNENPWEQLANHRETLEMCVEEDVAFADRARQLLDRLEEEGY